MTYAEADKALNLAIQAHDQVLVSLDACLCEQNPSPAWRLRWDAVCMAERLAWNGLVAACIPLRKLDDEAEKATADG